MPRRSPRRMFSYSVKNFSKSDYSKQCLPILVAARRFLALCKHNHVFNSNCLVPTILLALHYTYLISIRHGYIVVATLVLGFHANLGQIPHSQKQYYIFSACFDGVGLDGD
ncbi:MAG: hypothetical protein ACI808_001903 [Paraglaciecola sp.]|jgi:hypothetical protein